jgi:hypothetical protein
VNTKKKQLVMSLGIGLVCAMLGTFLVSKYTGQISTQFSSMTSDLQKQVAEKTKSAEALEKQLKSLQLSYSQLTQRLSLENNEKPEMRDPLLRYIAVPIEESQGWHGNLGKGSQVDIACSMRIKENNVTTIMLRNVLIADLDKPGMNGKAGALPVTNKLTAHLALKPDDASLLINAMSGCKLYFIEASQEKVNYTPVVDLQHFKPAPPVKLSLNKLPPPAPIEPKLPPPLPPETQKITVIKGSSQETLEFQR